MSSFFPSLLSGTSLPFPFLCTPAPQPSTTAVYIWPGGRGISRTTPAPSQPGCMENWAQPRTVAVVAGFPSLPSPPTTTPCFLLAMKRAVPSWPLFPAQPSPPSQLEQDSSGCGSRCILLTLSSPRGISRDSKGGMGEEVLLSMEEKGASAELGWWGRDRIFSWFRDLKVPGCFSNSMVGPPTMWGKVGTQGYWHPAMSVAGSYLTRIILKSTSHSYL